MAKEAIIEKLENALTDQIENECQVIYILTRASKILDINDQRQKYSTINFYRNWSVHAVLSQGSTASFISPKFDPHIDITKGGHDIAKDLISANESFFKLKDLKNELRLFCEEYGLPTELFDNANNWRAFMELLLEIIKDCPIVIKNSKVRQMTLVGSSFEDYSYKFNLAGTKVKPIVKLKLKGQ